MIHQDLRLSWKVCFSDSWQESSFLDSSKLFLSLLVFFILVAPDLLLCLLRSSLIKRPYVTLSRTYQSVLLWPVLWDPMGCDDDYNKFFFSQISITNPKTELEWMFLTSICIHNKTMDLICISLFHIKVATYRVDNLSKTI